MAAPSFSSPSSISSSQYVAYSMGPCFPLPFHLQQSLPASAAAPTTAQFSPSPYASLAAAAGVYPLPPHDQQAQHMFQKDAQIITPEALESVKIALARDELEHKVEMKRKALPRKAAGQKWEDPTLADWPENDYRLFCGDLGNEVNDDVLSRAFSRFPSFNMTRVVRDKRTGKTKGYGFVSFANPLDLTAALKEMNVNTLGIGQ